MTHTLPLGPTVTTPAGLARLVDDSTKGQALVDIDGRLFVFPAEVVVPTDSPLFA